MALLEISNDEQDIEKEGEEDEELSLPPHKYIIYKQVLRGEEEQADEICKIIN
jgi:hypothetical protein